MIGKSSSTTTLSFQKGFQTLNENLVRSNATLTQRLNAQQIEIDLLQEQVNAMDTSTTEFMVASKVSLGLDQVNNTSDENKELSKKARDALDLKHPLIQDSIINGKDQRLPQSHVQGLVSALEGKQPSITTSAKISMDKISDPYFANIQTSSADSTTLATALVNIPSSSIITSATGVTPKVTLDTTLGTFHPKIENVDNKRLAQNCVEGLSSALQGKQPLLSATNKLSSSLIVTTPASSEVAEVTLNTVLAEKQNLISANNKILSNHIITTPASSGVAEVTLDTALNGKQNLLSATNKLSSSLIVTTPASTGVAEVTLDTALNGKQNLLSADNKLSLDLIQKLYYKDIQVSSTNTATLATVALLIRKVDTYTITNATTPYYAVGSIIQREVTKETILDNEDTTLTLLNGLPGGTWSGFVNVRFFRATGTGATWDTGGYFTATVSTVNPISGDFFPENVTSNIANVQASRTQVFLTVPFLFRCTENRTSPVLRLTGNANTITAPCNMTAYLSITKIAN